MNILSPIISRGVGLKVVGPNWKSMNVLISTLLLMATQQVHADSYFCEAKEAVAIIQSSNNEHRAGRMKVDTNFILFKQGNDWIVKDTKTSQIAFDKCNEKGFICESSRGFSGSFVRRDNNQFSVFMIWDTDNEVNDSDIQYITYAGKCVEKQLLKQSLNKSMQPAANVSAD